MFELLRKKYIELYSEGSYGNMMWFKGIHNIIKSIAFKRERRNGINFQELITKRVKN